MGVNRIELVFRERPVTPSEFHWHIVKPARREATVEMPQPRNDHSHDRRPDVGTRLVEDEKIEAGALGESDAGRHLLARVEMAKFRVGLSLGPSDLRSASNRNGPPGAKESSRRDSASLPSRPP